MNFARRWIRNVFGFSGTEINGFLILIPLMLVLVFSEPLYHAWTAAGDRVYGEDRRSLDSLVALWEEKPEKPAENTAFQEVTHFLFDPNTASVEDLLRLGMSDRSARRIAAYRQKGGVFRIKSDLLKIYGFDSTLYIQLYKYINLPPSRVLVNSPKATEKKPVTRPSGRVGLNFDLNTADTTQLKSVYGIGPVLANRIIKFRDRLGGFVSHGQLKQVYGLDSSVVKRLVEVCFINPEFSPQKININAADERNLSGHPYISYQLARMLVNYRFQHGDFKEVSDIKNLSALTGEDVERLLPYLKVID